MRRFQHLALAALLALSACSDPVAPPACDEPCGYAPTDLAISNARIASTAIGTHPTTGRKAVSPTAVRVTYRVRNLGPAPARPVVAGLLMGVTAVDSLGTIAPGDSVDSEVVIDSVLTSLQAVSDVAWASLHVYAENDTASGNNFARTDTVHVAVPLLRVVDETIPDEVSVNAPFPARLRVQNVSHFATSPALSLAACLFDGFIGCVAGGFSIVEKVDIPAIAPRADVVYDGAFTIRPEAAWQDEDLTYAMYLCTITPGAAHIDRSSTSCLGAGSMLVHPDYEGACAPPPLQPDVLMTLTAYNCGHHPGAPAADGTVMVRPFHLLSLDALAGITYTVDRPTVTAPLRFYTAEGGPLPDLDPAADAIRVAASQRVYIATYTATPTLNLTVRQ